MKIAFFEVQDWEQPFLKKGLREHEIILFNERTSRGDFTCEGVRGFDLNGKVLGVLGTGRIGTKVIEIGRGFKMNVLAYDKHPNLNLADVLDF